MGSTRCDIWKIYIREQLARTTSVMESFNSESNQTDGSISKDDEFLSLEDRFDDGFVVVDNDDRHALRQVNPTYSYRRRLEDYLENKRLENLLSDYSDYFNDSD